jgi:hypothetical protein
LTLDDIFRTVGAVVAFIGGPASIALIGRTIWSRWTGRDHRREIRNRSIDDADRERRMALEYASLLLRQLLANGLDPAPWPPELGPAPRNLRKKES